MFTLKSAQRIGVGLLLAFGIAGCASTYSGSTQPIVKPPVPVQSVVPPQPAPPDWRPHFNTIKDGAILVDIAARKLTYWAPSGKAAAFPIAVPRHAGLEKRGETQIVRRREQPDWRPTPSMLKRNPSLPAYVGPGPQNPLGEYALYLGWQYYAIHGTNAPESVGTAASSGCFRLLPEDIKWLYGQAKIGTFVKVI